MLRSCGGGDDIDDRIGRADFVEVDALRRDAVDLAFGGGEAREDIERAVLDRLFERALMQQAADLRPGAIGLLLSGGDAEARRADRADLFAADFEPIFQPRDFFELGLSASSGRPRSSSAAANMSPLAPPIRSP
jgi:hypothetical protein